MLFGLPPLFGLLPLVVYIVLTLRGYQPLVATVAGVLVGAMRCCSTVGCRSRW